MVSLGNVCNTRQPGMSPDDPDDDVIRFTFVVRVEDHASLETGTKAWVGAGVQYSAQQMWVGQTAVYANRSPVPAVSN